MRKLVLIAAFVLTSVAAAEAGQSRSLVLAAHETPVSAAEAAPPTQATPAPQAQAAQAQTQSAQPQAVKPARKSYARRQESDEAKARRIAARYGVYW
jgi:hypothetical protein